MNTKPNFTNNSWNGFNWLPAALALAMIVPARAGTQPAAIPFPDIGARATANYQGDALGVTATADGAGLRCGFQKLEGRATPEGLWLESTKPRGGKLRLVATAMSRQVLDCDSPLPLWNAPAPTESGRGLPQSKTLSGGRSHFCPSGKGALATTGTVSVQDKVIRFTRPGLTEEYSVSVDGVRQGFIIESPPLNPQRSTLNQSAGDLRMELALSGARAEAAAGGVRLKLDGSGRALAYSRLRAEDATGRQLTARLEVLAEGRLAVSVADAHATYPVRIDPTFSDADWVSLGSGMNGTVFALAVSGTKLYAGGYFTTAGGVPATNIAKWDGSAWSALGSGVNSHVFALAVSGTDLYAAGNFTTAGGVPANYIAKWDGTTWSALGSGVNNIVYALAVRGTDVYAAGNFTTAGEVPANFIAKWDGSTWSALGSGVGGGSYPYVMALAVSGFNLYAGGEFPTMGGVPVNYIAKWDGSAWSALGSGIGGSYPYVEALAADGAGHLFVGGTFSLAGTNVSPYIAQANLGSGPTVLASPQTQTAEAGATVYFALAATGYPAPSYQWLFNDTNALTGIITNSDLVLTNILFSQSGTYTVVISNAWGAVTSAPVTVNVIPAVERRPVLGVQLMGEAGSLLNVDYANSLSRVPNWSTLGSVSLTSTSQYCFDLTLPLPPQRFYRAWQTGTPGVMPSLDLHIVPAITLTGNIGNSVRLDYINQFGPIDAWVTLDTVVLTNTSQLYFDVSAWRQPQRLYRLVSLP